MKAKKLIPCHSAPVKRENTAIVSLDSNSIASSTFCDLATRQCYPFASDGAE